MESTSLKSDDRTCSSQPSSVQCQIPDVSCFTQRIERLQLELEEAKNDAEIWGKAFDQCYEDLCDLREQVERLKKQNSTLWNELMWSKGGDVNELDPRENSAQMELSEVDDEELDRLIREGFDTE